MSPIWYAQLTLNCHISSVRCLLFTDATKTLVSAFVLSRLDYCNCLLSVCPPCLLDKLQKVQNNAVRLVLGVFIYFFLTEHTFALWFTDTVQTPFSLL